MPELVCAADDPRWLEERRRGVTATDITVITGLSPYDSAYSLFFKKRGDIPDKHQDNDRLRLGRELEPYIVTRWALECPDALFGERNQLYRSSMRPWQLATPDSALYSDDKADGFAAVLEVKSWADWDRDSWADGPPPRVRAQVLWQMDTLDVAVGHVGVLFLPSGEFRSYVIEHEMSHPPIIEVGEIQVSDCQVCADLILLREAGRDFMDRLDLNDPPSPDASTATLAALKARFADPARDKEAEIDRGAWLTYQVILDNIDRENEAKRLLEAQIREQAGEARILTVGGVKVATRVVGDSPVRAHTRHSDYIRRSAAKGDGNE